MSPELAGIAAGLGGALIGVLGTLYTAGRKMRRETRAAARLLLSDLGEARGCIAFALGENDWAVLGSDPPRLPSWEGVAQKVADRPQTWRKVNDAARAVERIAQMCELVDGSRRIYPDADPNAPGDSDRTELLAAQREIEEAILALAATARFRDEAEAVMLDRELAEKYP